MEKKKLPCDTIRHIAFSLKITLQSREGKKLLHAETLQVAHIVRPVHEVGVLFFFLLFLIPHIIGMFVARIMTVNARCKEIS